MRSRRQAAALFKVSVTSVVKWSQRFQATGSAAAKPMGGRRWHPLEPHRAWLPKRLKEVPHLTPRGPATELGKRGAVMSYGAVRRFLHKI